ncbi:hypothetical protein ACFVUS_38860 [Nocardia sp. NPDC058058]|uniref:hypothetical protein n=1 Tax=Nocardia sp. NPDC058058 TaxID=3346317 RepID=UPI0036D7F867
MNQAAAARLYLRIFLLTGIPFGVLIGLYDSITFARSMSAALGGLIAGVIFGALIAAFGGTRQLRAARQAVYTDPANPGLSQRARINLPRPPQQSYALAQQVLRTLLARITAEDAATGRITAQTPMSWQTFGETLTITVESATPATSSVLIESHPRLRFTAVDYGTGRRHVEQIAATLTDLAARGRAQPR